MRNNSISVKHGHKTVVYDMDSDICVWSKAGVVRQMRCINAFDCLNCPINRQLKKDVAAGRLKDGRVPTDWRISPVYRPRMADQMKCRHMLSGRVSYKYCIHNYDCDTCAYNQMIEDEILEDFHNPSQQDVVGGFTLAGNYYYNVGHTWARVEYGGRVRAGLDDFCSRLFGPFSRIKMPRIGYAIRQGEACFGLVRGSLQAECLSPVEGVVVAVNPKIENGVELPISQPYDDDWLVVIEPVRLKNGLRNLLFEEEVHSWMEDEVSRLTSMVSDNSSYSLAATGGRAVSDIFGLVPELGWDRLKKAFLHT